MPIEIPTIDDRRYQQLVDDSLARIPNHTPEWTNFNASDPGVTLVQVFAFLTESLLYRANQIPERNRLKFLQLLGVPLQPASSAIGLITITNERGPEETITLNSDLEVRAGQVSFRTQNGLDVLPVEAYVCFKATLEDQPDEKIAYYQELYASYLGDETSADTNAGVELYEVVPLSSRGTSGVSISDETVDNALWVALLAQSKVTPDDARREIAGKTVSIGLVPILEVENATLRLVPEGTEKSSAKSVSIDIPSPPAGGKLATGEKPAYRTIGTFSMLTEPDVFEAVLPGESELGLWKDIDPLELGADTYPPVLDDATSARLITWLRLVWPDGVASQVMWAGINATPISQRARVLNELLPAGTGEPDQSATLSHQSIISDSVKLMVTPSGDTAKQWTLTDDLLTAGSEVPTPDLRNPPGWIVSSGKSPTVFALDAEAGVIRFGDGAHGARPPSGATLRISYDYGAGLSGNVAAAAVNQAPALPSGLKVTNPISTWGGADAESASDWRERNPHLSPASRPAGHGDGFCDNRPPHARGRYRPGGSPTGLQSHSRPAGTRQCTRCGDPHVDSKIQRHVTGRTCARLDFSQHRLRLARAAPARDHRAVPLRPRIRIDLGLGRDRDGGCGIGSQRTQQQRGRSRSGQRENPRISSASE